MLSYRLSWLGLMNELNKERKTINDRSVKDSTPAAMKFFIFVHSNGYLKKIKLLVFLKKRPICIAENVRSLLSVLFFDLVLII